jgi:ATP-dependent DNA ligase
MSKLPTLYAKAATGAINQWTCWTEGDMVVVEYGQVGGALQLAHFKCKPKNVGRSNATTAEEQADKEAQAKWTKQRKKKYFLTPEEAGSTQSTKPMLAKDHKKISAKAKSEIVWPVMVQPKLDGRRCLGYRKDGQAFLQARGGDPYFVQHVLDDLEATLPEGRAADGELYIHGASRQYIGSLITRPRDESVALEYWVYDFPWLDERPEPNEKRYEELVHWYNENCGLLQSIRIVPTEWAYNEQDVIKLHDFYVSQGYEGAIIRLFGGMYRFGYRSGDLLKHKNFEDDEFEIVGYTTGKPGSGWERVPIFKCRMKSGVEFDVAPRGTEEERYQMLLDAPNLIGKMLTVRYQGFTDDGNLDFPIGIEIRGREDMS